MWSRIQDTELATEAYHLMNQNEIKGCEYHNYSHIEAMYQYLEDTNVPYDEALDWAVTFHDIVYDNQPDKEDRSADMFLNMKNRYSGCNLTEKETSRVIDFIRSTKTHKLYGEGDLCEPIIRADLHALTDKVQTTNNFVKIMNESMNLYGCTVEEFATNNIQFMSGLHQRMALNILIVDNGEEEFYYQVQNGINLTIRLAQSLKDTK